MSKKSSNFAAQKTNLYSRISMKKSILFLAFISFARIGMCDPTTWFDRDELGNGSSYSGICAEAQKGSNTEDGFSYMSHGSSYESIGLSAGHQVRIDAGFVNLDSVMIYMYNNTIYQAPLIASDGTELTYKKVTMNKLNYLQATWKNPGKFVGTLVLTVGDKATLAANEANRDKKGEAEIIRIDVYASEESGACGAPIPNDSVTLTDPKTSYTLIGDPEFSSAYELDAAVPEAGVAFHYPFELFPSTELEDGKPHMHYLETGAYMQIGGTKYDLEYGMLTIQQDAADKTQYTFHLDVIGANKTRYFVDWKGKLIAASEVYALEPMTPTTIDFTATQALYDDDDMKEIGELMVYFANSTDLIQLNFKQSELAAGTIVKTGTHAINDTGDEGTVLAGDGFRDFDPNEGSALYIQPEMTFLGWDPKAAYFIESGTVKVEASANGVKITLNGTSHYGSTIRMVYDGPIQNWDDVDIALGWGSIQLSEGSIQKILRDGHIYLMYNGIMYDVQGKKVR